MAGNQYQADPRQYLFKEYYLNPDSDTFSNAYQSAIKAGYAEEYAQSITAQGNDWFSEIIRDLQRARKAEGVLDEILEMGTEQPIESKEGDIYTKVDTGILKIKQDTAKFVSERLNPKKYGAGLKITDPDGKPIQAVNIVINESRPTSDNSIQQELSEQEENKG